MLKRILIFLAPAILIASLLVGCGGGDATLSRAEFIKKADAICKKTDKAQVGEAVGYQKAHTKELATVSREAGLKKLILAILLPSVSKEAKEIEALGAPSGGEKTVQEFISAMEQGVKQAEKEPTSVEDLAKGPFSKADTLAREYGLQECAEVT
jgi:hypothetical protein